MGSAAARAMGACVLLSTLSTATSVPGSLPARVAGALVPSGRVTVISSSRRMVCSAVTMTPGRQNTPLEEKTRARVHRYYRATRLLDRLGQLVG